MLLKAARALTMRKPTPALRSQPGLSWLTT